MKCLIHLCGINKIPRKQKKIKYIMELKILYRDTDICVVQKEPGMLCEDAPGGIPPLLRAQLQTDYAAVVHRLDAGTGGAMVFALNKNAAGKLSLQLQAGEFAKTYLAVTHGCPPEREGIYRDLLFHDRRANKTFVVKNERKGVKEAVMSYRIKETADGLSLWEIQLLTGRTHQIRVQLGSRKMPLVGDRRYGARDAYKGFALWAKELSFCHPQSEQRLTFTCLPDDAQPWNRFTADN